MYKLPNQTRATKYQNKSKSTEEDAERTAPTQTVAKVNEGDQELGMEDTWAPFRSHLWAPRSCPTCERLQQTSPEGSDDGGHRDVDEVESRLASTSRTLPCSLCPASFSELHDYEIHGRLHSNSRPFVCNRCAEEFASMAGLLLHRHEHNNVPWYICDRCNRCFHDIWMYVRHVRWHRDPWRKIYAWFLMLNIWRRRL